MVSLWPWKGDDSSPASFEKALSGLSEKINKASGRLDTLRQRSRRLTGLWTLYSIFLYLLYSVILVLVVGWRSWGIGEYAAVVGGPFVFYMVRLALTSYYQYRTSTAQSQLEDLQKQRDATIKKLKAATKYDSTQELLKKYGGTPTPKPKSTNDGEGNPTQKKDTSPQTGKTGFVPPPTANIPGRNQSPPNPQMLQERSVTQVGRQVSSGPAPPWQQHRRAQEGSAEFAPNAFPSASQYASHDDGPHWYDKVMDLLMGEDETLPGKRLALICQNCRLVNGQAPPGAHRLEDVGMWRCMGCGTMNGEESDVKKIVASIKSGEAPASPVQILANEIPSLKQEGSEEPTATAIAEKAEGAEESDVTQYSSESDEKEPELVDLPEKSTIPPESTRRRSTRPKKGRNEGS